MLGRWSVEVGPTFKTEWNFTADGVVTSTEGGSNRGRWAVDNQKRRFRITWEGVKDYDVLSLPVKPDGPMYGETTVNRDFKIKAVKIK